MDASEANRNEAPRAVKWALALASLLALYAASGGFAVVPAHSLGQRIGFALVDFATQAFLVLVAAGPLSLIIATFLDRRERYGHRVARVLPFGIAGVSLALAIGIVWAAPLGPVR